MFMIRCFIDPNYKSNKIHLLQPFNVILTFILNSFSIMVVALLLADVFSCLAHRVRGPTSTAHPLQSFFQENRRSSSPERNVQGGVTTQSTA